MIYTHFDQIPRLRYGLIVADPPWSFRNYSKKGEKKNPSSHYACMSKEDINRLPVAHIAAPDCLLWLWAVNPMLPQALETMQAWGFTFVSAGSWSKRTESGKMRFGPGYWLRSTNEPYLIGRIGNPKIQDRGIPSGFDAPAREHSRKPEMAYGHARRMAPHVQAIDLFSRQEREGFDCFGNEVGKFQEDAA